MVIQQNQDVVPIPGVAFNAHDAPDLLASPLEAIDRRLAYRKVFFTDAGFASVGTASLKTGDLIALPCGAVCLDTLRPTLSGCGQVLKGAPGAQEAEHLARSSQG